MPAGLHEDPRRPTARTIATTARATKAGALPDEGYLYLTSGTYVYMYIYVCMYIFEFSVCTDAAFLIDGFNDAKGFT